MRISVALATYNGGKYITEQLNSILPQLTQEDEIIISDDGSTDSTLELIAGISMGSGGQTLELVSGFCAAQIKVLKNPGKGVISNFENAVRHASGDIIFLCDQDDVWHPDKVAIIKNCFAATNASLIITDAYITDQNLNVLEPSFFKLMNSGGGVLKNFIKNTFLGCCMAFRKELKEVILPFPEKIPMHDSWIGILAQLQGDVLFIPEKLVYYRRHEDNASALERNSLKQSLVWRKNLAVQLIKRHYAKKAPVD